MNVARFASAVLFSTLAVATCLLMALGDTSPVASAQTAAVGQWSAVQSWPVEATSTILLPTGRLLIYPAWTGDQPNLWDPASGSSSPAANAGYNIFCDGITLLGDGRLFAAGGHTDNKQSTGLLNASLYDGPSNTWTSLPNMNAGRWYPTTTTLASGDVLVVSGSMDDLGTVNQLPQIWQTASGAWRNLTSAAADLPLYPQMYLAPNGNVYNVAPNQTTTYINTSGAGAWTNVGDRNVGYRQYSTSVLYDTGKILLVGGGDPPMAAAEVIDLTAPQPMWRTVASMAFARKQAVATLLPDGKVLVTGGSSGPGNDNASFPVYAAETWDPLTEQWTTLASEAMYRGYHSTAILLPDGRVASAGGEYSGANAEIFSPPYLFNGTRPTVTSAPSQVVYGQTFDIATPDAASIAAVNWIRLGAVTHAFNMNQRINKLSFTQAAGRLSVTAPSDAQVTPPGDYLLFILNASGVPSVAATIRIGAGVPNNVAAPTNLAASATGTKQINLTWQDNSTNETGFRVSRSLDGTSFTDVATLGANTTTYLDGGLAASTKYYYRVVAFKTTGGVTVYSSSSNVAGATTSATGPPKPKAPTNLTATAVSASQINLTWQDNSNNETSFWIARSTDGANFSGQATLAANSTSFSDTGLAPSTKYYYYVLATNASVTPAISSNASNTASATTGTTGSQRPGAPTNLSAMAVSASQINLTWQDNSNNETSFWIARSTDGTNFSGRTTLAANSTSFSDTGLAPSTNYFYYVLASNAGVTPALDSPSSNIASATTAASGVSPTPNAPTNLTATAVSASQINLTWQDNSTNETSFWVARSTDGVHFTGRATLAANVTTFTDTGLAASTKYYYYALATNANVTPAVDSQSSNIASATTTP